MKPILQPHEIDKVMTNGKLSYFKLHKYTFPMEYSYCESIKQYIFYVQNGILSDEKPELTSKNIDLILGKNGNITYQFSKFFTIPQDYSWCENISEYVYCIKNNLTEKNICACAGCNNSTNFLRMSSGYAKHCSCRCSTLNEETQQILETTMISKYGVSNGFFMDIAIKHRIKSLGLPASKEKRKKTNMDRYGFECTLQEPKTKGKRKQTMMERYGSEYTLSSDILMKKYNLSMLKKFGVFWPRQNKKIINKQTKTRIKQGSYRHTSQIHDEELYRRNVQYHTLHTDISNLKNVQYRGKCGIEGAYQLDHKISIHYGFHHGILPYVMGHISNLQMLHWEENREKSKSSYSSLEAHDKSSA